MNNSINTADWTLAWAKRLANEGRMKVWFSEATGSTNSIAKEDAEEATTPVLERRSSNSSVSSPTLYLTRHQVEGRGRGANRWAMPEGALFASWSFALDNSPQPILSPLVGLALYKSAQATWPEIAFNLKAPNDLYIDRKKTAGLLIETVERGRERRTIVGLGLNVATAPADVATATCLANAWSESPNQARWESFLEVWTKLVTEALVAGQRAELNFEERENLRDALNKHPLLDEPVLDVDERGQLRFASGLVHWHEL